MRYFHLLIIVAFCILGPATYGQYKICINPFEQLPAANSGQNGIYNPTYTWPIGATINIKFLDGTDTLKHQVVRFAKIWEEYANIHFNFIESGNAEVRISFYKNGGCFSEIGTYCRNVDSRRETMNFGWFDSITPPEEIRRTVLHEFGHLLGLLHEHQNPLGKIKWNEAAINDVLTNTLHWTTKMIAENFFDKYSVNLSNHEYDSQSIMHYPIPAEFTLDGFSVGWNNELSAGDKKLIAKMYPKPVSSGSYMANDFRIKAILDKITVTHNVKTDNKAGMNINLRFNVDNADGKKCSAAVYFYDSLGNALRDRNNSYRTDDSNVATQISFIPSYDHAYYPSLDVFMPYEELDLDEGEYSLKFRITFWDDRDSAIGHGDDYYFTYRNGIAVQNFNCSQEFDDNQKRLLIYPKFSLKYAKGQHFVTDVFLYSEETGEAIKDLTGQHSTTAGELVYSANVNPGNDIAYYNLYQKDFPIPIRYMELAQCLNMVKGAFKLKYFVTLRDVNGHIYKKTDWQYFTFRFSN